MANMKSGIITINFTKDGEQMTAAFERLSQSIRELNSRERRSFTHCVKMGLAKEESVDDLWERVCGPCEPNRENRITGFNQEQGAFYDLIVEEPICFPDHFPEYTPVSEEESIPVELPGYLIELPVKEEVGV